MSSLCSCSNTSNKKAAFAGGPQFRTEPVAKRLTHPEIRHIKVEDGKGKPLGRTFRVKLWPTLVFLRDGQVVKQVARPEAAEVREGLEAISSAVS